MLLSLSPLVQPCNPGRDEREGLDCTPDLVNVAQRGFGMWRRRQSPHDGKTEETQRDS